MLFPRGLELWALNHPSKPKADNQPRVAPSDRPGRCYTCDTPHVASHRVKIGVDITICRPFGTHIIKMITGLQISPVIDQLAIAGVKHGVFKLINQTQSVLLVGIIDPCSQISINICPEIGTGTSYTGNGSSGLSCLNTCFGVTKLLWGSAMTLCASAWKNSNIPVSLTTDVHQMFQNP